MVSLPQPLTQPAPAARSCASRSKNCPRSDAISRGFLRQLARSDSRLVRTAGPVGSLPTELDQVAAVPCCVLADGMMLTSVNYSIRSCSHRYEQLRS
jgi:hypothetical protein